MEHRGNFFITVVPLLDTGYVCWRRDSAGPEITEYFSSTDTQVDGIRLGSWVCKNATLVTIVASGLHGVQSTDGSVSTE